MKFKDILNVLRKGGQVKNPETWKNTSATAEIIFSILVVLTGLIRFFGVDLVFTDEILMLIATGIAMFLTASGAVITLITSRKVGLPGLAPAINKTEIYGTPEYIKAVQERVNNQDIGHDY